MGISPIEYKPWEGKRSNQYARILVISQEIFLRKLRSKWVLALIILGAILTHVFPLLFYPTMPHEGFDRDLVIGAEAPNSETYIDEYGVFRMGALRMNGTLVINGTVSMVGEYAINGSVAGAGYVFSDGSTNLSGFVGSSGSIFINGTLRINGTLGVLGSISGNSQGYSNANYLGNGWIEGGVRDMDPLYVRVEGYLTGGILIIFTLLLASLVCSDLISEDIQDRSFVLYFSRPLKTHDYVLGKVLGAFATLSLYCVLPPLALSLAMIATQSGDDYSESFRVMGATIASGILMAFLLIPLGLFISSITKRKAYAAIGTFMSFFVLMIISGIFRSFNGSWALLDPGLVMNYSVYRIFGASIPDILDPNLHLVVLFSIMIAPLVLLYFRLFMKGAGK